MVVDQCRHLAECDHHCWQEHAAAAAAVPSLHACIVNCPLICCCLSSFPSSQQASAMTGSERANQHAGTRCSRVPDTQTLFTQVTNSMIDWVIRYESGNICNIYCETKDYLILNKQHRTQSYSHSNKCSSSLFKLHVDIQWTARHGHGQLASMMTMTLRDVMW